MSFHSASGRVICFACGCRSDIFDLVANDYGVIWRMG
jgi:hypothetical protein